jgi:DMSO/TMAO reductase YedYZ molybdopterin-dependent catalytic subunit
MWTRRRLIKAWLIAAALVLSSTPLRLWAKVRKILPKGFPKNQLLNMNPADVDSRDLEIDALGKLGTMGPTDVEIDIKTFRLKVTGRVERPLSLTYDEIQKLPATTEAVLLICPGFFANHVRWTGCGFNGLLEEAKIRKEATSIEVKGAGKAVRIPLEDLAKKRIFLAYRINGEVLPRKHGFPLRLVFEDVYGYDWVKFVDEIAVL